MSIGGRPPAHGTLEPRSVPRSCSPRRSTTAASTRRRSSRCSRCGPGWQPGPGGGALTGQDLGEEKTDALIGVVREAAADSGHVSDPDLGSGRRQRLEQRELAEAFAYLGLTVFTSYFLNYAQTPLDLPMWRRAGSGKTEPARIPAELPATRRSHPDGSMTWNWSRAASSPTTLPSWPRSTPSSAAARRCAERILRRGRLPASSGLLQAAVHRIPRRTPGPGAAASADEVILDFLVDDVDAEYPRIAALGVEWVMPPTTQPWGNRSMIFRDPAGNLVNVFSPARTRSRLTRRHTAPQPTAYFVIDRLYLYQLCRAAASTYALYGGSVALRGASSTPLRETSRPSRTPGWWSGREFLTAEGMRLVHSPQYEHLTLRVPGDGGVNRCRPCWACSLTTRSMPKSCPCTRRISMTSSSP